MSADGEYVFFESPVALTPGALNEVQVKTSGRLLAENVYEYHNGNVSLISDGKDTTQVSGTVVESCTRLLGTDATGHNVFFATNDRLTSQDTDTQRDYYDARVCETGDPCFTPPATPVPCQEEGCHTPNGEAPISENERHNERQNTVTKTAKTGTGTVRSNRHKAMAD